MTAIINEILPILLVIPGVAYGAWQIIASYMKYRRSDEYARVKEALKNS